MLIRKELSFAMKKEIRLRHESWINELDISQMLLRIVTTLNSEWFDFLSFLAKTQILQNMLFW
jgi:hypothetical protein